MGLPLNTLLISQLEGWCVSDSLVLRFTVRLPWLPCWHPHHVQYQNVTTDFTFRAWKRDLLYKDDIIKSVPQIHQSWLIQSSKWVYNILGNYGKDFHSFHILGDPIKWINPQPNRSLYVFICLSFKYYIKWKCIMFLLSFPPPFLSQGLVGPQGLKGNRVRQYLLCLASYDSSRTRDMILANGHTLYTSCGTHTEH